MRIQSSFLTVSLVGIVALSAQQQMVPARLSFEVASIKPTTTPADGPQRSRFLCRGIDSKVSPDSMASAPPLGRCVIRNMTFLAMFRAAYRLPNDNYLSNQLKGDLAWLDERFDIDAKAEDPASTTLAQLLQMSQTLLADRFKATFHRETKQVKGYVLSVAGKAKIEATNEDVDGGISTRNTAEGRVVTAHNAELAWFADSLSSIAAGPVVDKTDLKGHYNFTLTWGGPAGASIFTALQEQLGLRLVSQNVPMEIFILESAAKPELN